MSKFKKSKKDALKFFKDNYIMISSLESKCEKGCAERCMDILENSVKNEVNIKNVL